eukprot:COSAG02_NODE_6307_length_3665_cov_3.765564_6_plen_125_part_00
MDDKQEALYAKREIKRAELAAMLSERGIGSAKQIELQERLQQLNEKQIELLTGQGYRANRRACECSIGASSGSNYQTTTRCRITTGHCIRKESGQTQRRNFNFDFHFCFRWFAHGSVPKFVKFV